MYRCCIVAVIIAIIFFVIVFFVVGSFGLVVVKLVSSYLSDPNKNINKYKTRHTQETILCVRVLKM